MLLDLPDIALILTGIKKTENVLLSALSLVLFAVFLGIPLGIIFGPIGILHYGGRVFIQHYTLRFILWHKGFTPLKYDSFLDYATDRIFLRKVGKGYIFIHRLLQEHFANFNSEQAEALCKIARPVKVRPILVKVIILLQSGLGALSTLFALLALLSWIAGFGTFEVVIWLAIIAGLSFVGAGGLRKRRR